MNRNACIGKALEPWPILVDHYICGLLSLEQSHSLELVQMYVSPNVRGKSIGQTLLTKAKSVLQDRNGDRLELTVYKGNLAAIKSYEKFGFIRVASQLNCLIHRDSFNFLS
ncbi:GNAT family N-acetyltransferase [Vibrio cholerae]|uniref:GNAT family N-acetyltransferase n=1 Tax=Vibrio cholerae TaxID=666 RepID=UPI0021B070BA|nr:GNAT family N-acetyltransferase [Vibrio cholerae]